MQLRITGLVLSAVLVVGTLASLALDAGGSGSSNEATSLLKQTFGAGHKVQSGYLSVKLTVNPSGSSTLEGPVSLSLAGPFQSVGAGKLPRSNFTVTVSARGKVGSLSLLSTGQAGFITLNGASYEMPRAAFQQLESSFEGLTSTASGSGVPAKLGINPLRWLVDPRVAGSEAVGGTQTTHIKAGVNVAALLGDLETLMRRASSLGVAGVSRLPTRFSPASRVRLARQVHKPRFDLWTGNADKTPRKIALGLTLPVSGQVSALLGGLRSVDVALSMRYAELNQPQTITAPSVLRPSNELGAKLRGFELVLRGILGGTLGVAASSGRSH